MGVPWNAGLPLGVTRLFERRARQPARQWKEQFMSEGIETLSDATFDEHVKSADTPVLVDFWAEWCGPCKMIAPILEEISGEQKGKIEIAKLNIDENLDITRRYEVMSIPTMILFKDGEPQMRIVGARGKAQLLQELQAYL
jgi:thioredoxin 1